MNRTLEFQTAEWLLERNEDELALKVRTKDRQEETKQKKCRFEFRFLRVNIRVNRIMIHFHRIV